MYNAIALGAALQDQQAPKIRRGMNRNSYAGSQQQIKTKNLLGVKTAISAKKGKKPKNVQQTIQKLMANKALPAHPTVVQKSVSPVLDAIKKGGSPLKAVKALKSQSAIDYSNCALALETLPYDQKMVVLTIRTGMYPTLVKSREMLDQLKTLTYQSLGAKKSGDQQTQSMCVTQCAVLESQILQNWADYFGAKVKDANLYSCLISMAKDEARLKFETIVGSDTISAEEEIAQGQKDPEEIVSDVEAAEILEQAAGNNVGSSTLVPTQADSIFTVKNIAIAAVFVGGLYYFTHRK